MSARSSRPASAQRKMRTRPDPSSNTPRPTAPSTERPSTAPSSRTRRVRIASTEQPAAADEKPFAFKATASRQSSAASVDSPRFKAKQRDRRTTASAQNQDDLKQRYETPIVRQLKPPPGPRRQLLAVHSQVVKTLSQIPSNAACADCGQRSTWCCTTLCTFVCGRCAVLLTELPLGYETKPAHGPALANAAFTKDEVVGLLTRGNAAAAKRWLSSFGDAPPPSNLPMAQLLTQKYVEQRWKRDEPRMRMQRQRQRQLTSGGGDSPPREVADTPSGVRAAVRRELPGAAAPQLSENLGGPARFSNRRQGILVAVRPAPAPAHTPSHTPRSAAPRRTDLHLLPPLPPPHPHNHPRRRRRRRRRSPRRWRADAIGRPLRAAVAAALGRRWHGRPSAAQAVARGDGLLREIRAAPEARPLRACA